ncbi:MAG: flagellar biosynthesis protein FlhA, partial [Acidobacteria bacterium]|nr:flagellar biosynthesis protein FlhA [Acidobacteriota bacterium]
GWRLRTRTLAQSAAGTAAAAASAKPARENLEALLKVDPLAVEVGLGLVSLVEGGGSSPLLQRISAIRRQLATQIGYLLPPVKVNDNVALRSREYILLLKGVEVARYELPARHELAIPAGKTEALTDGKKTKDPAFGLDAWWIPAERADAARRQGYTVVDAVNVLGTHLAEVIRRYSHEMLTRQDTKGLLDRVAMEHPKIVEDLVPKLLPLATVQRVLQNLLRERVSIRDAVSILEALGEAAVTTRNPVLLTEYVRQAIRRSLAKPFVSQRGDMNAWFLDPQMERTIEGAVEHSEHNSMLGLAPQVVRDILTRIGRAMERPESQSVIIASSSVRYFLRQLLEMTLPSVTVLAHNEIPPGVKVISMGVIA